jgi:hypothetical protein
MHFGTEGKKIRFVCPWRERGRKLGVLVRQWLVKLLLVLSGYCTDDNCCLLMLSHSFLRTSFPQFYQTYVLYSVQQYTHNRRSQSVWGDFRFKLLVVGTSQTTMLCWVHMVLYYTALYSWTMTHKKSCVGLLSILGSVGQHYCKTRAKREGILRPLLNLSLIWLLLLPPS